MRISAIKTSQAYQEMADGQPWDKLTENMRKTILYHHILEQVSTNLGSTMQDTTALRMAQFTASLADVRMALGQAFLPIAYTVLPLLNRMTQALYRALQVVAGFMRSLFGGGFKYEAPVSKDGIASTNAQADALEGLGDSAEEAGKKTQKAKKAWTGLFGFDEVNTIKDPETPSGGAGGAGGDGLGELGGEALDVPAPNFTQFEEAIDKMARGFDKFTRPIRVAFSTLWDIVSTYAREKIAGIRKFWEENGGQIVKATKNVGGFIMGIFKVLGSFIWDSIKLVIDGVIQTFEGLLKFFSGVFTADWQQAWNGIKDIFSGVIKILVGFWNLTFIGGLKKFLLNFVKDGLKIFSKFIGDFKTFFNGGLKSVKTLWDKLIRNLKDTWTNFNNWIKGKTEHLGGIFSNLWEGISKAGRKAVEILKQVWGGIKSWFVRTVITPIVSEMDNIKEAFSEGIGEGFIYLLNQAIKGFNKALSGFNTLKNKTPFADKVPDLKIPYLAQGGITNGPTLAMVGDNVGGREVISPLDQLQGFVTNAVVQAMQLGNNNNQTTGDIVLNIDGRTFARVVKPFMEKEASRIGTDVRIRTI